MSKYRKLMSSIHNTKPTDSEMEELKVILEEHMEKVETRNPEVYNETMIKLERVIYKISPEKAQMIVKAMKPFGEHWTHETVKSFIESKGVYEHCTKYYLVMNMMFNDYYDVATNFGHQNDTNFYFDMAKAFINDVDGDEFKVEKYFMC